MRKIRPGAEAVGAWAGKFIEGTAISIEYGPRISRTNVHVGLQGKHYADFTCN